MADPGVQAYLDALQQQQVQNYLQAQSDAQKGYLASPLAAQQAQDQQNYLNSDYGKAQGAQAAYLASPYAAAQAAAAKQVPDLTPSETQHYNEQQTNLDQGYGQQSAQNAYARANQQANHLRSNTQLGQQYDQQRSALPGRYAHRGLLDSGIYNEGLQKYATNRTNAFDNSNQSYAQALGQGDLNDQQSTDSYHSATANLAAQKAARRADLASQLRTVQ